MYMLGITKEYLISIDYYYILYNELMNIIIKMNKIMRIPEIYELNLHGKLTIFFKIKFIYNS